MRDLKDLLPLKIGFEENHFRRRFCAEEILVDVQNEGRGGRLRRNPLGRPAQEGERHIILIKWGEHGQFGTHNVGPNTELTGDDLW